MGSVAETSRERAGVEGGIEARDMSATEEMMFEIWAKVVSPLETLATEEVELDSERRRGAIEDLRLAGSNVGVFGGLLTDAVPLCCQKCSLVQV